jgi:plastocyanin
MSAIARLAIAGLGLVAFGLTACGGDTSEPAASEPTTTTTTIPTTATTTVELRSFAFQPGRLEIDAGTTVEWTNGDDILHTVTSGTPAEQGVPGVTADTPPMPDGRFELALDGADVTGRFTFDTPGSYSYFCAIHTAMTAEVVVR